MGMLHFGTLVTFLATPSPLPVQMSSVNGPFVGFGWREIETCFFSGCGRADDREPRVRAVAPREGHQRDHLRRDDLRRLLPRRQGLLPGRLGRTPHDRDRGQVRQLELEFHTQARSMTIMVNAHIPILLIKQHYKIG